MKINNKYEIKRDVAIDNYLGKKQADENSLYEVYKIGDMNPLGTGMNFGNALRFVVENLLLDAKREANKRMVG